MTVAVDAHGGDKEREQDALWLDLRNRLVAVVREPQYAVLLPEYWDPTEEDE